MCIKNDIITVSSVIMNTRRLINLQVHENQDVLRALHNVKDDLTDIKLVVEMAYDSKLLLLCKHY